MKLKVEKMVCCADSYVLWYAYILVLSMFSDCVLFYHAFQQKNTQIYVDNTFLLLVNVGLGHGVYRKLYTFIGSQRALKFENN